MTLPQFDSFSTTTHDGLRLDCQRYGTGERVICVANGIGGTLLAWSPLLEALKESFTFISWDYRGLYGSEAPRSTSALTIEDHAHDLQSVMDQAEVERATVAGWSLGVQVAIQAAADIPDRINGLVLVNGTYGRIFDTAFTMPGSKQVLPLINQAAIAAGPLLPSIMRAGLKVPGLIGLMERTGMVDRRLDREIFWALAKNFPKLDFARYHTMLAHAAAHDGEPLLSTLDQPMLMVVGGRDRMTPASILTTVSEHVPHVEICHIPRGTHYSLIEYPDEVVGAVTDFLERNSAATFKETA